MAVLLPNVEFVFGLAGSTASTLMAFILPAAIFLSVTSGQRGMMGYSVDMPRSECVWGGCAPGQGQGDGVGALCSQDHEACGGVGEKGLQAGKR